MWDNFLSADFLLTAACFAAVVLLVRPWRKEGR